MRRIRALFLPALLLAALVGFGPAAGDPGRAAACPPPGGVATPVGVTDCAGVRPGQAYSSPRGGCSLNFLFTGSDGNRYFGSAGHCILSQDAGPTTFATPRPEAKVNRARIGEFVYAVLNGSQDFALIKLDPGVAADPQMPHFGGPTGLYTEHEFGPQIIHHHGHGIGVGNTIPARTGVATSTAGQTHVNFFGTGVFGDSGSGAINGEGLAIGVVVTLGAHQYGTNGISRFDYQLPFAEDALGITLTLQTAPLF